MENLRVKLSKMSFKEKADLFEELVIHCLNAGFRFEIERDGNKYPRKEYIIYVREDMPIEEEIIHLESALRNMEQLLSTIISMTVRIYDNRETEDLPETYYKRLRDKIHKLDLVGWRNRSIRNYLLGEPDDTSADKNKGKQ